MPAVRSFAGFGRYVPGCTGKRGWTSKKDAKRARLQTISHASSGQSRRALGPPYRCPHCGLWHNGHPVKKNFG